MPFSFHNNFVRWLLLLVSLCKWISYSNSFCLMKCFGRLAILSLLRVNASDQPLCLSLALHISFVQTSEISIVCAWLLWRSACEPEGGDPDFSVFASPTCLDGRRGRWAEASIPLQMPCFFLGSSELEVNEEQWLMKLVWSWGNVYFSTTPLEVRFGSSGNGLTGPPEFRLPAV